MSDINVIAKLKFMIIRKIYDYLEKEVELQIATKQKKSRNLVRDL